MKKIAIPMLIPLAALVCQTAQAHPPPAFTLTMDIGTVSTNSGSGLYCTPTPVSAGFPSGLTQTGVLAQSLFPVAFGAAFTTVGAGGFINLCVDLSYSVHAFGSFSGSEMIVIDGVIVEIDAIGDYV